MIIQFSNDSYGVVTSVYYSYSLDKYFIYYWSPLKYVDPGIWDYNAITEWGLQNHKSTVLGDLKALNSKEVFGGEIE